MKKTIRQERQTRQMAHGDGRICDSKRDSVRHHDSGGEMI